MPAAVDRGQPAARVAAGAQRYRTAFAMQYGSIFFITTIVCLVGAAIALFIEAGAGAARAWTRPTKSPLRVKRSHRPEHSGDVRHLVDAENACATE